MCSSKTLEAEMQHGEPPSESQDPVRLIHELFRACSHQDQLKLLEDLPSYLNRDFVSLLPLELVEEILSYLSPSSVLGSCILVSGEKQEY